MIYQPACVITCDLILESWLSTPWGSHRGQKIKHHGVLVQGLGTSMLALHWLFDSGHKGHPQFNYQRMFICYRSCRERALQNDTSWNHLVVISNHGRLPALWEYSIELLTRPTEWLYRCWVPHKGNVLFSWLIILEICGTPIHQEFFRLSNTSLSLLTLLTIDELYGVPWVIDPYETLSFLYTNYHQLDSSECSYLDPQTIS